MLTILGSTWGALVRVRASLYERGWLPRRRLDRPVVSIGGLSVGGAGKTPTTALVATLLSEAGFRPAILSRGYRRSGTQPLDAAQLAAACGQRDVFLLDDGFQHLRLARDANLLVVNPEAPFWDDEPMPSGRLRESPEAAHRADAFLVIGASADTDSALESRFGDRPRFTLRRQEAGCWGATQSPPAAASATSEPGVMPAPPDEPAFAFAGIARPSRFFDEAAASDLDLRGHLAFPDHHAFTAADLEDIAGAARRAGAAVLVTTEKDAVRLPDTLPDMPIWVWGYRLAADDPEGFCAWLTTHAGLLKRTDAA